MTDDIASIIGIIALITFFMMVKPLQNISISVRNTNRIVSAWSKETGIEFVKSPDIPIAEKIKYYSQIHDTNKGKLEIQSTLESGSRIEDYAFIDWEMAPDDKYKLGFMFCVIIKDGKVTQ